MLHRLAPSRVEARAALLSSLLFAFAFPPFRLVVPALICLVPIAVAVARQADEACGVRTAARAGFWFGFLGYAANLYWIAVALSLFTKLAILGYIASLMWLAPFIAFTFAALYMARRLTRWPLAILLPVVWTASELVLNYLGDLAFPWLSLGLTIAEFPVLVQTAELSGVRGVSFWLAAVNGLLADAWMLRATRTAALRRLAGAVGVLAIVTAYGAWRMRSIVLVDVATVTAIQPNIPEDEKLQAANRDRFLPILAGLTRQALAAEDPDLILWPETALPGYLSQHPEWADTLGVLARMERTPILFGVIDVEWQSPELFDYFNAAMLTDSTGFLGSQPSYHKAFLVPIVERVPFLNPKWFSGLRFFGGFGRGVKPRPFAFPWGEAGVVICYEAIFPQLPRSYRKQGAELLLNITNDAWFGRSSAPHQHFAHLALRAIETRMGVVRSANTGISGYVDPLGVVRGRTELFVSAAPTYRAQTTRIVTPYVRIGDWLGALCAVATAALVLAQWRRGRRPLV